MPQNTIYELLRLKAEKLPEAEAILCPDRPSLNYAELFFQVKKIINQLQGFGIRPNDPIAVVLPNGPEMATAFLATACAGTSAPLNPRYTAEDYKFYLSDLNAKALIVLQGSDSVAVKVAKEIGVKILKISISNNQPVSAFILSDGAKSPSTSIEYCQDKDRALLLHTSGTTSRPKLVQLTHENICMSAMNIGESLSLETEDRCLNVMPLFHIHGLVGAMFSSLSSGGSVVCAPDFNEDKFFDWVTALRPTWYTAVPTMHQAILNRALDNPQIMSSHSFRFIRSCSASLPPTLMADLEKVFNSPVIEAYGMTEASHQISVNPLPPHQRKPKSVGLPTGTQVAIMDAAGELQSAGDIGEIVIKGPSITNGYENNPAANEEAFESGWFHTGDQGYIDSDGYIFITGRIKEIVNRGGEKISPREIDEVFLDHPQVAQAIAFALPHPTLDQDLAVAVVPKKNAILKEEPLREFAFERLAPFKVPSKVVIIDSIPKGPTGKLQRIGLHNKLADAISPEHVAPRNVVEKTLIDIWAKLLNFEKMGAKDNFFLIGGDSIKAVQLVAEIKAHFGVELPLGSVFRSPTVEQLSRVISLGNSRDTNRSLAKISTTESQMGIYGIPGTKGNIYIDLGDLAKYLAPEFTVYGFQDSRHNPSRIESLAGKYVKELLSIDPDGPFCLFGICSGAVVAFEMAQQLKARGEEVAYLGMIEPTQPRLNALWAYYDLIRMLIRRGARHGRDRSKEMLQLDREEKKMYLAARIKAHAIHLAVRRYKPRPYPEKLYLYLTNESLKDTQVQRGRWSEYSEKKSITRTILGTHNSITGKNNTPISATGMQSLASWLKSDILG